MSTTFGKPLHTFPDHALEMRVRPLPYPVTERIQQLLSSSESRNQFLGLQMIGRAGYEPVAYLDDVTQVASTVRRPAFGELERLQVVRELVLFLDQ
ncbi:hypothetical protein [Bradyrhizobium sp. DOA9]|uniref:hypothetical protein n=1 Tax=Bradyrhizobium sp. DOA9 TaxID=1126627 RepID=UPI00178CBAA0|nr:hypothetical protein [Bradyrhizobium sp. DOA9]